MYHYEGSEFEGVTIVGHGLSLKVFNSKSTVEYDGTIADYFEVLESGRIIDGTMCVTLNEDQLSWLKCNRDWVNAKMAKDG
jgi:hypothetical protein